MATETKGKGAKGAATDKQHTLILDGGIKYKGEVKAQVPHTSMGPKNVPNEGKMEWPNGDVYIGQFKNGKRHGKGRRKNEDGSTYEGYYEDD